jgi:hypothetical protein
MKWWVSGWLSAALLTGGAASAVAADYWAYRYHDFDVLAEGSSAYSRSIVVQLNALDQALQTLLGRDAGAAQPPTRIYALHDSDYTPIDASWGEAGGAFFRAGPFDNVLVVPSENEGQNSRREMYAARARAWLDDQGLIRLPEWFKHGFGLLVGTASFDNDQLTLGQEIPTYMARMKESAWISVGQLFFLPPEDERFHKSRSTEELYDAECWWLTHLALLDGVLDKSMGNYLSRLQQGQDAPSAFTAAFNADIDTLDTYFRKLRRSAKLRTLQRPITANGSDIDAVAVDALELKARLSQLAVLHDAQSVIGKQWATEVISAVPDNERALLALVDNYGATREYKLLLNAMERLGQRVTLSAAAHTSLAAAQISMAHLRDMGTQGLGGLDANTLRGQARSHLNSAMQMDATDPLAPYTLGWLLASQGDVSAVQQLLPHVEQVFYQRPYTANLADLLVRLHTLAGNTDAEFKFAVVARRLAPTAQQQYAAQRRIERLRPAVKSTLMDKPSP